MTLRRSSWVPMFSFASLLLTLGACGGGTDSEAAASPPPATDGPSDPAATTTRPFDIQWETCSIPSGRAPIEADCATIEAPARRDIATDAKVKVAVYRLKAQRQPAKAQLWMLNGGPGGAGYTLAPYGDLVRSTFAQDIDVYMVDHRGTGESMFLECDAANAADTPAEYGKLCSAAIRKKYPDSIDGFSTTESAHDVRELIDSTVAEGQKVFVYGGSYGSYWAHRFLQLPKTHVDAVVTDGNCIGTTCTFDVPQTFMVDEPMRAILETCKSQSECSAHFGGDPWTFTTTLLQKLSEGHCSTAKLAQLPSSDLAMNVGIPMAALIPPVLYRLNRCSPDDVTALDKLAELLFEAYGGNVVTGAPGEAVVVSSSASSPASHGRVEATPDSTSRVRIFPYWRGGVPKPTEAKSFSQTLQLHVIASEMISKPAPTAAELAKRLPGLTFKPSMDNIDNALFDAWKGYPPGDLVTSFVERDVPWLMLQGDFDFQTAFSLSQTALKSLKDPSLQFVKVDGAGHGVAFDSACARTMVERFLEDPKAKVDASCVPSVKEKSLELPPRYVSYFFGTPDAWD